MLPLDLLNTYESLHSLRQSNDEWRYVFMADDEFRELMSEDAIRASGVYWKETQHHNIGTPIIRLDTG
jgi:hypothetical protein